MEIRIVKDRIECSGAIICAKDTSRILLLQKTEGKHAGRWVLPGGTSLEGETAFQGLQRELQEEVGCLPNFIKIIPLEKLHVIGNVIATGTVTCYYSDERLKNFTSNIYNSLDIINNLNGYYYLPNTQAINAGFENEKQIGLSAQEVQKVLPEIVKIAPFDMFKDENGNITSKSGESYLTICYERLAPVFVEAIKELTLQIKELKEENKFIKKQLHNSKNNV